MKIIAKNFLSWEYLEFDITDSVTLVDGWNNDDGTSEGSGKSAIVNALCYGLFGKLPKDVRVDEVIRQGEKSCEIIIEFKDYKIVRRRGPNEIFLEYKDSKRVKGKDAKETQGIIEEIVGFSFETFLQTIYFAQNYGKKFITSSQEDKGRILSEIQDLGIFDRARDEARQLEKKEKELLTDLRYKVELHKQKVNHVRDKRDQLKAFAEREAGRINSLKIKLSGNLAELFKKINSIEPVDTDILERDKKKLMDEYDSLMDARREYDEAKYAKDRVALDITTARREQNDILRNNPDTCDKCGSKIESLNVDKIIGELGNKIEALQMKIANFPLPESPKSSADIRKAITIVDNKISEAGRTKNRLAKFDQERTFIEDRIKEVNNEKVEDVSSDIEALEEHIFNLTCELEALNHLTNDANDCVKRLGTLKTGYKEIKSFVFNTVLNELSHKTNNYLIQLFEVPISIKFINENMKIQTKITIDGSERSLGLLSGGQFRRVSLAVDLSLSDIISNRKGSRINLLIMDEYFKDLSEQSMEKCLKLLESLKKPTILIEHNSIFKSIVDNVFEVELTDGVSYAKNSGRREN